MNIYDCRRTCLRSAADFGEIGLRYLEQRRVNSHLPLALAPILLLLILSGSGCQKTRDAPPQVANLEVEVIATSPMPEATDRPIEVSQGGYVSSQACRECHPQEHSTWHGSYHRTMTQVVDAQTVLGRFDGQEFSFYGWTFRPHRQGDEFWLDIHGSSGSPSFHRQLLLATGSHHMQKYWYPTGKGREMGLAPLVYLIEADLWIPEHTAFLRPTESGLPVREGTWNKSCNQCHATGPQPRLFGADGMDTRVAEFGISCESCHGPGHEHVRAMSAAAGDRTVPADSLAIVNPRHLSAERSVQVCGQCHGIWTTTSEQKRSWAVRGHTYRPGDNLDETRRYISGDDEHLIDDVHAADSFWSDGQIRVTGREYNGLLASPCFAHDGRTKQRMTCLSCHDMHAVTREGDAPPSWANDQLAADMHGNEACYQCHGSFRQNLAQHTRHASDSTGSLCYNCHMPYTSYGLLKAVRSHTITSPSVETTLATGRPNACNQCHLDQTLQWTAQQLNSWFGHETPVLTQNDQTYAASLLWSLKGDAGQRALMAWSMGWESARKISGSDWLVFFLTDLMFDDYDAIRYIAYRSLKTLPGFSSLEYDHMNPQQEKARIIDEVMAIWQSVMVERPRDAKLLFDSEGNLRFDLYQSLRAQRNNRKVVITE